MEFAPFYSLPLWIPGLIFVVVLSIALETGFRIGLKRREYWKDAESGGGAIVQTTMFTLMGLMIAFTYAASVSRYDARKIAINNEAKVLGTAFLRAELIAEPGRTELKATILDYARTRYFPPGTVRSNAYRQAALKKTLEKQAKIWPTTMRVLDQVKPGTSINPILTSINNVLEAHVSRLAAVLDKLPRAVMWMLLFVAAGSLCVAGYNAGIQGRISRLRTGAFILVLSVLMLIILDLDRPNDGFIIVNQFSIDNAIKEMETALVSNSETDL